MTRLQEYDIQRTLLPVSHASVPLSTVGSSGGDQESSVGSLNLRSYVPLTRSGTGATLPISKFPDESQTVSREGLSALSGKSKRWTRGFDAVPLSSSEQPRNKYSNAI